MAFLSGFMSTWFEFNFVQDLPEHFEDNMQIWMTNFLSLLTVDNKLLHSEVGSVCHTYVIADFVWYNLSQKDRASLGCPFIYGSLKIFARQQSRPYVFKYA